MFTGLIECKEHVRCVEREAEGMRLTIGRAESFADTRLGDSVAISGCCLTVVQLPANAMEFQAGSETLSRTTLGNLIEGSVVNCERSLKLSDRIGGHLVTGHVDGVGKIKLREDQAAWCRMVIEPPGRLMRQMASKGSVAVDGVSLTIVDVTDTTFSVALIPYTLQHSSLGGLRIGDAVNIETDLLAKYVARQLEMTGKLTSESCRAP